MSNSSDGIIRIVIADNSAFARVTLSSFLNNEKSIKVISTARTATELYQRIRTMNPDLVIVDINKLPEAEGPNTIKKILEIRKIPILITRTMEKSEDDPSYAALQAGAVDIIVKPADINEFKNTSFQQELLNRVRAAVLAKVSSDEHIVEQVTATFTKKRHGRRIIVIGSSTGGPQTLEQVLPLLPANLPCSILVVQHMPPNFTKSLADRLNNFSEIRIKEAEDNEEIKDGVAYIAPGDFHMTLKEDGPRLKIALDQRPRELGVRPCANYLFESVAKIYKENMIAVVLTGMGNDGTAGCKVVKEYNGTVLVESERSSIIFGMPRSVIESGYYDEILDLEKIPVGMVQLLEV
jgi:two-component system, chemotaxis family, protein-glutamate methylesterase/glutaminase